MGMVIDLEQARLARRTPEAAALARLDEAIDALAPFVQRSPTSAEFVARELAATQVLVKGQALDAAAERLERLASMLAHASARRSS